MEAPRKVEGDPDPARVWVVWCSCGWRSSVFWYAGTAEGAWREHVSTLELMPRVDTPTNRQAIVAHVHYFRSLGKWPSYVTAAAMLAPTPMTEPGELPKMPHEWVTALRVLCQMMCAEGVLTFSGHGYLGVGEKAPF